MKVHVLLKIARQVEGDYVYVNAIRASTNKNEIQKYLESCEIPPTEEINGIGCVVEVGILEDIEVD